MSDKIASSQNYKPEVIFHVTQSSLDDARIEIACSLAANAWRKQQTVLICCESSSQCQAVDQLLWQFDFSAFIPHALIEIDANAPVVISTTPISMSSMRQIIINLHDKPIKRIDGVVQILEIVSSSTECLAVCREHFRYYKTQNLNPVRKNYTAAT